jgi:hypothetical protein
MDQPVEPRRLFNPVLPVGGFMREQFERYKDKAPTTDVFIYAMLFFVAVGIVVAMMGVGHG